MSKSGRKMDMVSYIDELVDATIRLRAVGDRITALGVCAGGYGDGTVIDVGEIVSVAANRLEDVIARIGDDMSIILV